jgi:hypothetical protein
MSREKRKEKKGRRKRRENISIIIDRLTMRDLKQGNEANAYRYEVKNITIILFFFSFFQILSLLNRKGMNRAIYEIKFLFYMEVLCIE